MRANQRKTKMKKILTMLALTLATTSMEAKSLVFTLKNGSLVYYQLGGDVNPVMLFKDGKACVNADAYEISEIKNFYISDEDDPNAINQVKEENVPHFKANTFSITASESSDIHVYDVNGTEVKTELCKMEGYVNIDLAKLKKGIYLIKVDDATFKVRKN